MKRIGSIVGSTLLLLASSSAHARWESLDEASASSMLEQNFEVNRDGTYTYSMEGSVLIKKDGARSAYGTIPMRYNSGRARVLSVSAETTFNGKAQKVSKDQIEDKPEKAKDVGFDKTHNLSIAFPNVNIGSTLHYKVRWEHHTVPLKNQFSENLYYGFGTPLLPPSKTRIASKIPLSVVINDPEHYLAVDHRREGGLDIVEVKLLRPVYFRAVNEKRDGWFKALPYPQVSISSTQDWADIGNAFSPDYEHELTQTLPVEFARIADKAFASNKTFVERSNAFTADLAEIVRYHGDWRTRKGSYIPRPLKDIQASKFGDCKDMALVTAASLRRMGYKASIALINRGYDLPKPMLLPATSAFNHAIVRVEDEKAQVHWVDPTNKASRAQAIRADIAGRPALVLDGPKSRLENTTDLKPEDASTIKSVTYDFYPKDEIVKTEMNLAYKGFFAERLTGWELSESKRQIGESLLSRATDGAEIIESSIEPFDLSSRIVRDLDFKFAYTAAHTLEETSAGLAFNIAPGNESLGKLDVKDRVSGFSLGTPESYEIVRVIKDAALIGKASEPCKVQSPWMNGERRIEVKDGSIYVTQKMTTKAYGIGTEEFATPEFRGLQKSLQTCMGSYTIVFSKSAKLQETASTH